MADTRLRATPAGSLLAVGKCRWCGRDDVPVQDGAMVRHTKPPMPQWPAEVWCFGGGQKPKSYDEDLRGRIRALERQLSVARNVIEQAIDPAIDEEHAHHGPGHESDGCVLCEYDRTFPS